MKKALVVLLALAFVGAAFAEDAAAPAPVSKVGAYLYASTNLYDQDGAQSLGPSWLSSGNFADLTLSYSDTAFGFSGTVEYENDAVNTAFRDYTLWAKPIDMLKVSVGKLRNGDYRLTSYIDGSGFNTRIANAEYGLMLQATPIAGLSVGVFNYIPASFTYYKDGKAQAYEFDVNNLNFGASYTVEGIAKFIVAAKRNPIVAYSGVADNLLTVADEGVDGTIIYTDEYFFGADIKAVEGLTAKVGLTMDLTDAYTTALSTTGVLNNTKWNKIWVSGGYTVAGADIGLDAYYLMNSGTEMYGKVNVAYALEKFTPSAYFSYKSIKGYEKDTALSTGKLRVDATATTASTLDYKCDGTAIGFGAQLAVPAGSATIYLGADFSVDNTNDQYTTDDGLMFSFPVAVEISF